MFMRGLETVATAVAGFTTIGFISAWEATGEAGRKYRQTVKSFWYVAKAIIHTACWFVAGFLARTLSLVDPIPGTTPGRHPRAYLYRRTYRGRHFSGTPLLTLLTTKQPADALAT